MDFRHDVVGFASTEKSLADCRRFHVNLQTSTTNLARLTAALERNEQLTRELETIVQVKRKKERRAQRK